MRRTFKIALTATALTALSLYLWRIAYVTSDWAVLALAPLALVIGVGSWPLILDPWRARLHLALRNDSPLGTILTGHIRAAFLSVAFTIVAVTLMAWQALGASTIDAFVMVAALFTSATAYSEFDKIFTRHLHHPFARTFAVSLSTWVVALPFTIVIALSTWAFKEIPGEMLNSGLQDAFQIGLGNLPSRGGWIAEVLAIPYGYNAAKLWVVVQLRDYPIVGALFSLDAALYSFVLCHSAAVISQFTQVRILKTAT